MRHSGLPYATALFAFAAACSTSDFSLGPNPPRELHRDTALDCEETADQCAQIQRGINYLKDHANPICRAAGTSAQQRYDAPSGEGFRPELPGPGEEGFDMSVYTNPFPSDGYTNVYPQFWTKGVGDQSTGALIAHEEIHHIGGSETEAVRIQDECMNPQS